MKQAVEPIRIAQTQMIPELKAEVAPAPIDQELDAMFGKQVESEAEDCLLQKGEDCPLQKAEEAPAAA